MLEDFRRDCRMLAVSNLVNLVICLFCVAKAIVLASREDWSAFVMIWLALVSATQCARAYAILLDSKDCYRQARARAEELLLPGLVEFFMNDPETFSRIITESTVQTAPSGQD